jgi:fatty acid/phospholipid biosynthesis enzyme
MTPEVIDGASQILSKHLLLFAVIAQMDLAALAAKYPQNTDEMFSILAAQELIQRREQLISRVRNKGALALEIAPNSLTTALVNQYLEAKERGKI